MKVGEQQSPEEEDKLSTRYKALCLALDNGNIDKNDVEPPIVLEYTTGNGEQIKEEYRTFKQAKEAFDVANKQICNYYIDEIKKIQNEVTTDTSKLKAKKKEFDEAFTNAIATLDAAIEFQSKNDKTPNLDCLWARASTNSNRARNNMQPYDPKEKHTYITEANKDFNMIILKSDDDNVKSGAVKEIIENLKLKAGRTDLVEDLNTLIAEHSNNTAPAELYFERAKQQVKLYNNPLFLMAKVGLDEAKRIELQAELARKAERDLLSAYEKGLDKQQQDPLFCKELGDLHTSLGEIAENQKNKDHSMSAKKAYRNMFLRKMEITEELDAGLKNEKNYEPELLSKFDQLTKLEDVLKQSEISIESHLTEEENNRLENTNYLRNRIIYNKGKIDETGFQSYKVRHRYDLKNKKDYFEGNFAFLNNTYTGGVIKVAEEQTKYKSPAFYTLATIIAVPITALIELPIKYLFNGIGNFAFEMGASVGLRANNKPAHFLSQEDVNNLDNPEPGSSTGNDIAVPIIESPSNKEVSRHDDMMANIRAYRGRAGETKFPTSKVDNTKQQMEGFAGKQDSRLATIEEERESLDQQTGPHAGQKKG